MARQKRQHPVSQVEFSALVDEVVAFERGGGQSAWGSSGVDDDRGGQGGSILLALLVFCTRDGSSVCFHLFFTSELPVNHQSTHQHEEENLQGMQLISYIQAVLLLLRHYYRQGWIQHLAQGRRRGGRGGGEDSVKLNLGCQDGQQAGGEGPLLTTNNVYLVYCWSV